MDAAGWVSIIAAIGTAVTAILSALALILVRNVKDEVVDARTDVAEVHTIVNQQKTNAMRYEKLLVETLQRAQVRVPVDASIDKETPQE